VALRVCRRWGCTGIHYSRAPNV